PDGMADDRKRESVPWKLLVGQHGLTLRQQLARTQLGNAESSVERVAQAVEWVRKHFDEPMNVESLAEKVHMGVSTLHAHFKEVTGMSPVQYQKVLRLQEARRLLASTSMDAGAASRQVGYASALQFSREYSRLFGTTPSKDIARLREPGAMAS
uniref:helix-turn-helix domain-containing protein n=1 Tax=Deinococcus alpinitundrae TaxID=468913 RepID=UPI00137AB00B